MDKNITIIIKINNTVIKKFIEKAKPLIIINISSLYRRIEVVDILGEPLESFSILIGGLKFRGRDGVADVIPLNDDVVVVYNGISYLLKFSDRLKVPTLSERGVIKMALGAAILGAGVYFGLGGRREAKVKRVEM